MSGHNRWTKIKHKKEATSAKKSKLWTKLIKEITVAAKLGGGDPAGNARLRQAIDKGKAGNVPSENIERAIKKGTGELEGVDYEEFHYEVYAPGGAAILVEVMTDNRNRTASDVRSIINRTGGNLAAQGAVSWMFHKRGIVAFDPAQIDADAVTDAAIELGAEDVNEEEGALVVTTSPQAFEVVLEGLKKLGDPITAEVTRVPENTVKLEGDEAEAALKLISMLEDSDDVQNVYANLDVDESLLEADG